MKRTFAILSLLFIVALPLTAWPAEESHGSGDEVAAADASPNEASGEHGGEHEAKTYFGIPGWILKTVNIFAFLGLLIYLIKAPLQKAFEDRREGIQKKLAEAEERRRKSDSMAEEIQKRLEAIEKEVDSILARAREEGERQKREIIASAESESKKILATAESQIDQRLKQARRELTDYAGVLAAEKAKTMIEEKLTDDDRKRFFGESVEQIGELKP